MRRLMAEEFHIHMKFVVCFVWLSISSTFNSALFNMIAYMCVDSIAILSIRLRSFGFHAVFFYLPSLYSTSIGKKNNEYFSYYYFEGIIISFILPYLLNKFVGLFKKKKLATQPCI